ncbi:MAG: hypothetical protein Q8R38_02750 [Candidatus Omnitrophota bacterium]|nr:hypothetical protein [Candidatus Omnitrophota bacterium]
MHSDVKNKKSSWNFLSAIILAFYAVLQLSRWGIFPQHFDIWYHLLTAWGFIKAGGYTTWDFWQYAPFGRPHIYPPLFHIMLALPMKMGIDKILLAKLFNLAVPVIFLSTLWNFIRKYFNARLAFLVLIVSSSSLSFYLSLADHIPSTIAMIFGLLMFGEFFNKRFLRAGLLLALAFYTHIGTAWFLLISFFVYILLNTEEKRPGAMPVMLGVLLSLPIIVQQALNINLISLRNFNEQYFCEFKTIEYILAAFGLVLLFKKEKRLRLFAAFFIASFVYAKYSSRFFSSEGYLPIAILAAFSIDALFGYFGNKIRAKAFAAIVVLSILILSPTVAISLENARPSFFKIYLFDSTFMDMIFGFQKPPPASGAAYFNTYNMAAQTIKDNSAPEDIVYCTEETIGLCLAVLSGRATADYLLPEVYSEQHSDAMANSKMVIMLKYHSPEWVKDKVDRYGLKLIGKTNILDLYKNPSAEGKMRVKFALVSFNHIFAAAILWLIAFIFVKGGGKR